MLNEVTVSRSYKVAKAYSSEVLNMSESQTITGTADDAYVLGRVLMEKVKVQVWIDALDLGILPFEDIEIYREVATTNIQSIKESLGEIELTEANQATIVANILIVDKLIELLDNKLNK